jgi:hypothetical protein
VQDDVARAIESAGVVAFDLALGPARTVPRLPDERRVPRVDAVAADRAVEAQYDRAGRDGVGQPDEQRVSGLWHLREARQLPVPQLDGPVDRVRAGCLGGDAVQLARRDLQLGSGAEDDGLLDVRARGRDLCLRAHHDGRRLRSGQPEGDGTGRRGGREQMDTEQVKELDVVPVGHPVQPVDQLIDHLRERLDQRHSGVGDVVVGPFRASLLDQAFGVVDEVLEAPVIEIGGRQRHGHAPPDAAGSSPDCSSGMM